jgi:hypothetical protein
LSLPFIGDAPVRETCAPSDPGTDSRGLTIKLSDRRWRAGLSVKDACEQTFRNERRSMAAVHWTALVRLIVAHVDGTNLVDLKSSKNILRIP